MVKSQHGNKEAKKPKKVRAPLGAGAGAPAVLPLAVAQPGPDRQRRK